MCYGPMEPWALELEYALINYSLPPLETPGAGYKFLKPYLLLRNPFWICFLIATKGLILRGVLLKCVHLPKQILHFQLEPLSSCPYSCNGSWQAHKDHISKLDKFQGQAFRLQSILGKCLRTDSLQKRGTVRKRALRPQLQLEGLWICCCSVWAWANSPSCKLHVRKKSIS